MLEEQIQHGVRSEFKTAESTATVYPCNSTNAQANGTARTRASATTGRADACYDTLVRGLLMDRDERDAAINLYNIWPGNRCETLSGLARNIQISLLITLQDDDERERSRGPPGPGVQGGSSMEPRHCGGSRLWHDLYG